MAAKVNLKFVAILAAGVVVVAGGLAFLYVRTVTKSAADHARLGDELVAKGEYEKAAASFAKAVNKSKANPEYVHKWIGALEQIVPASAQTFNDKFSQEYLPAMRALAEVQPGVVEAQRPMLELMRFQYRLFPPTASQWEAYAAQVDSVLRGFVDQESADAKKLRYYRGMAQTILASMVSSTSDDTMEKAKGDLEAALSADPTDAWAMSSLGDWYRVKAQRLRQQREMEAADKVITECRQRLNAFITANPVRLPVLWTLTQVEIYEESRLADRKQTMREFYQAQHPKVTRLIEEVLAEPPEKLDRLLVFQVCAMATASALPEAMARIDALLNHAAKAKPDDVLLHFKRGELEFSAREYERAIKTYDAFTARPNLPVGLDGMLLFVFREEALARQADACLALWEQAKDKDEQAKRLAEAKAYKTALAEKYGKSPRLTLLEAKLKYCERDMVEARRLLTQYTDQNPSDVDAIKLLADVLLGQQQYGAAKLKLEQARNLNAGDVVTTIKLAEVNEQLQNFAEAGRLYRELRDVVPMNDKLRDKIKQMDDLAKGADSEDPVVRVLTRAQEKVTASPPDAPGALAMIRDLVTEQEKAGKLGGRNAIAIARALLILEDRTLAGRVLDTALKAEPGNQEMALLRRLVDAEDPTAVQAQLIDEQANLAPTQRALLRYQLFRRAGRMEEARAELAKAREADPENGLVISAAFDEALLAMASAPAGEAPRLKAEARALAEKAVAKNIDRVNGKIFMIRLEQIDGRLPQAAAMAQEIIDQDPLNPLGHRLLGVIRLQQGQFNDALASFEKAIQYKPDDVENIKGKARALIGLGRLPDALLFARESKNFAGGDADFADILLSLEGEVGNVDFAIERRSGQMRRNPNDRTNALELAALLMKARRWDDARKAIDAAAAVKADFAAMRLDAQWLASRGDLPTAKARWDAFLAALPKDQMTIAYVSAYREFLAGFNDFEGAKAMLERFRPIQTREGAEIDRELGDLCFARGDWACAQTHYESALRAAPKDEGNRLRFRILEATLNAKQFDKAAEQIEAATRAGVPDDLQFLLLKAETAAGRNDKAAARRFLDMAIAREPNAPIGFYKRAEFLVGQMQGTPRAKGPDDPVLQPLRDAGTDLETALRLESRLVMARRLLSRVRAALGNLDDATKLLQDGLALNPDDGALRIDMVELLSNQGNIPAALGHIEEAIRRSPDPQWKMMAGDLLRKQGEIDRAAEYYGRAWETTRTPPLARAYCDTIWAQAKPDLGKMKAILADPGAQTEKWPTLLTMRAKIAARENRWSDAEADLRTAFVMLDTANAAAAGGYFQDAGEMYAGKIPTFIALLESMKPATGFTDPFRAQLIRFKLSDPTLEADGLKDLDGLIAVNTNQAAVLSAVGLLGDLMYAQKRYPLAVEVWTRYLRLQPDDPEKLNNMAYALSKHMGKHDQALPMATKACTLVGNNPNFLDTLAVIQLALAQVGEAESSLMRALDLAKVPSQQVPVYIHLAQVALAKGNRTKANEHMLQADRLMAPDARLKAQFQEEFSEVRRRLDGGR